MRQRILAGSGNAAKLAELRRLLVELPVELLGPEALSSPPPEVAEDGDSFLENAMQKALAWAEVAARDLGPETWALADDSGLEVEALDGAPGICSARFAGVDGPREVRDAANNALLLQRLQGLPPDSRGARFVCVIALARAGEVLLAVEGEVRGRILEAPRGSGGFGYDPLFFHEGLRRSFAELGPAEKAQVSHRAQAVDRLRFALAAVLPAEDGDQEARA